MDRIPSSNNERAVPPVPKEIYVPNYLRNNLMLIEMQNSKELKEEFSSIDFLWLRRNTPWPKLVQSAVYRYLHFHDLYQIDRDHEVDKLVDYIFQNGELPNDLHCKEQMVHRCKKLILSTSKWAMKGLLGFNKDNRLVKSEMFQNAWNNQLLIMRNRSSTTNLANVEQFEDAMAVERPNSPAKTSEASAVPDLSVEVSSALPKEGQPNAPFVTSPEPEPDIKVDPDEPKSLTNEHPKLPLIPVLDDTSSNTVDATYDGPDSYCHGLPNFEFKSQDVQVPPTIPVSLTHVPPSQKIILQNVVFLKDLVCHNYLSETKFLCQKVRFEASAHLLIPAANSINRFATYSAIVLCWQSDDQFLRFWRSLIDPNYTLIEFTFSSAPWLSGFTIDTNNDGDLTKARQHIWDGFWIFIDIESRSLKPNFRILAKPKLPYLLSVPSKRPTDSTHDLQRPCPRGKEKEPRSKKTNEGEISSPRSDGHVRNGSAAPCERSQSIGQTSIAQNLPTSSKRPVAHPRVVSQQSSIALSPANAQINPPNVKQQQWSRPESLTLRLKDAVPVPITYTISRSGSVDGVDRLAKLRAVIKRECANAGRLIMGLEKFEIFIGVTEEGREIQGMEEESNQIMGEEW
ncbi:hypothetical protein EYC80_010821 [Monilinia laxa]|uniref:Uncharacterized protein n=1 Tax=Monilinia laxa TaxID=61186 RepID=A0A5N6JP98_MONLA|nr:hypothetical protein EYC80_010821 [Monilinia laxa]